ncbi:MAG: methionyl-tRNA formyltransferase [Bacillota bacterium]
MDILFMGSPDFAVESLERLYNSDKINIKAVISQPDRKKGRGQKRQATAVKEKAVNLGLNVLTSNNVNKEDFIQKIKSYQPEAIVVVAFGQKLSKEILTFPKYGCINLHASLLPKYRGSSPIHQAIINGDEKTGVTTMYMDEELDKGDIIYQKEIKIDYEDTVGDLHDKLALKGANLLLKTLLDLNKGNAPRRKQDDNKATYAFKIDKTLGRIDWSKKAQEIYNLVRGVNPWPGAYTKLDNDIVKIWEVSIVKDDFSKSQIGEIIKSNENEGLIVQTGKGYLRINKLQVPGKKRMKTEDYLRGNSIPVGKKFS